MSVWQDHFHWRVVQQWEVLGWIVGILLAVGGIVLFFDQYWWANICFILIAVLMATKVIGLAVAAQGQVIDRIVFAVVLCCAIGILAYFPVNGVRRYRDQKNFEQKSAQLPKITPSPVPQTLQHVVTSTEKSPIPDLIADFVKPKDLELVISNPSLATAHQPTFGTDLINLDNPSLAILPIGRQTGDFLRPKASLLRIPLLHYGTTAVLDQIRPGDRLFGWMSLSCADCKRIRWYWIYYEYTKGGWYAETTKEPISSELAKEFSQLVNGTISVTEFAHPRKKNEIRTIHGVVRFQEQGTLR